VIFVGTNYSRALELFNDWGPQSGFLLGVSRRVLVKFSPKARIFWKFFYFQLEFVDNFESGQDGKKFRYYLKLNARVVKEVFANEELARRSFGGWGQLLWPSQAVFSVALDFTLNFGRTSPQPIHF
jgi:hypothetical protein